MTTKAILAVLALSTLAGPALAAEAAPAAPPPAYGAPITLEQARTVIAAAETEARRRGIVLSVAVVDSGGYLVASERMTGASLASSETPFLKAKSAVLWQRSTATWLPAIEASHGAQTAFPNVWPGAGGEPIVVAGRIVGGVGVGGAGANEDAISKMAAGALR